jgi:hypothetical protein
VQPISDTWNLAFQQLLHCQRVSDALAQENSLLKSQVHEYALLCLQIEDLHKVMQAEGRVCQHLPLVHQCRLKYEQDMAEFGKLKERNMVQSQMITEGRRQVQRMSKQYDELMEEHMQVKAACGSMSEQFVDL